MKREDFVGTKTLIKLAIRRDRVRIPLWIIGLSLLVVLVTLAYQEFSVEEMEQMVLLGSTNPGMRLLVSPIDPEYATKRGVFLLFRMSFILAILVAIMTMQLVFRHTRHNEETGSAELLGSMILGRYAFVSSALFVACGSSLGVILGFFLSFSLGGLDLFSSFVAGLSYGVFGLFFAGIASITAQLAESTKGAFGLSSITLAIVFMINALGNLTGTVQATGGWEPTFLVWFSPLFYIQRVYPFAHNSWEYLLLPFSFSILLICFSFFLVNRRDVGRGMLKARRGPAFAAPSLLSPLGLALRLQRGSLIGWSIPLLLFGLMMGAASTEFGEAIADNEMLAQFLSAESIHFSFLAIVAGVLSMYTAQALKLLRLEEQSRLEALLVTGVNRVQWMMSHILCSVLGTLFLLLLFSLAGSLPNLAGIDLLEVLKAALYQGTALFTLAGLLVALFGLFPKVSSLLSGVIVFTSLLTGPAFGPLLQVPETLQKVSPFSHVAMRPSEVSFSSLGVLLVLGSLFFLLGIYTFRSRDLSMG